MEDAKSKKALSKKKREEEIKRFKKKREGYRKYSQTDTKMVKFIKERYWAMEDSYWLKLWSIKRNQSNNFFDVIMVYLLMSIPVLHILHSSLLILEGSLSYGIAGTVTYTITSSSNIFLSVIIEVTFLYITSMIAYATLITFLFRNNVSFKEYPF